jgi:hypothetical protein
MRISLRIISGLVLLLILGTLVAWWCLDREAEYNGKPVGYWVDKVLSGLNPNEDVETFQALRHIGAPAAAPLVQALTLTDSPLRHYYTGLRSKLPASLNRLLPHQRLDSPNARNNAFAALEQMGPAAKSQVPELIGLLNHADKQVRIYATLVFADIGPDAKAAVPALLDESRDSALAAYATSALRSIEGDRQTAAKK